MDNPHFSALEAKHADLDEAIAVEARRPSPDMIRVAKLKKEKLRIKEELARI